MRMIPLMMAAALALMPLCGPVSAEEAMRQIVVTGEGRVTATPDMAMVRIGVMHRAKGAGEAMDRTSDTMVALLERLTTLGVARRDVQTSDLSLNEIYDNRNTGGEGPRVIGFQASNSLSVRVRELAKVGEVIEALLQDGANRLGGLRFGVQYPDPLIDEARRRAVSDGTARAQLYAKAAGVTLGPVQSISEAGASGPPQPMMMEMALARDSAVPVAEGELELSAQVRMVFAIAE